MRCLLFPLAVLAAGLTACGLADDPQLEKNKHTYINIPDPNFRAYCLRQFDANADDRISRYEAQRVRRVACAGLGIGSLTGIEEFTRLERLDCSGNDLPVLDVSACVSLRTLVCADNGLASLDVSGLRSLTDLDCSGNALGRIDLDLPSLATFVASRNAFTTLDVSACAPAMECVDVRENPALDRLYVRSGQVRRLLYDAPTEVEER